MDSLASLFALGFIGATIATIMWSMRRNKKNWAQKQSLSLEFTQAHPDAKGIISQGAEWIDDALWQVHGDVVGGTIRPGMRITLPDRQVVTILEVYADEHTPENPSKEAHAGATSIAVTFELPNTTDGKYFDQFFAQNPIMLLEVLDIDNSEAALRAAHEAAQLPTTNDSQTIVQKIVFLLIIIVFLAGFGATLYQGFTKEAPAKPKDTAQQSSEAIQTTTVLGKTKIQLGLPKDVQLVERTDTSSLFGLLPLDERGAHPGEVIITSYQPTDPDFLVIANALDQSTHQTVVTKPLQRYCKNMGVSSQVRIASVQGAQSSLQTAFTCEEQADKSDRGGYVAAITTEQQGYIVIIAAHRSIWESNASAWDGIIPSLRFSEATAAQTSR